MAMLGGSPAAFVRDFRYSRDSHRFRGFVHRFHGARDMALLTEILHRALAASGTLGHFFTATDDPREDDIGPALARFCQRQGFDYVIRVGPDVHVRCASYEGKLIDYPVRTGICKLLRQVDYRQDEPVTQNVVVRWVRGLPEKRDECWFLISSLDDAGPAQISKLYGQRMTVEQLFRDHKSKRNGWSLRDTMVSRADRLDRLLLVLALAYLMLCGIGLAAARTHRPSAWCSNSKEGTCSIFVIGQVMMTRITCSAAQAFAAFLRASEEAVPKWG